MLLGGLALGGGFHPAPYAERTTKLNINSIDISNNITCKMFSGYFDSETFLTLNYGSSGHGMSEIIIC